MLHMMFMQDLCERFVCFAIQCHECDFVVIVRDMPRSVLLICSDSTKTLKDDSLVT